MRVLITGVSGFVGSRLAPRLVARGDRVFGTFIHEPPRLEGVDLHEIDLLDRPGLDRIVSEAAPEAIIHLAGLSHVGKSWSCPGDYFRVNVLGSENLLRAAPGCRLLAASSAEIYGPVPEEEQPIDEDRPVAPPSPYALTKAAMERLVLAQDAIIVRSFNIVGPGQVADFALPAFAAQLAAIRSGRQPASLRVGNLSARRDFVHLDDAVEAYTLLLDRGVAGKIYNLGSGVAHSIEDAVQRLIRVSGVEPRIEVDPERFRPVDLPLLLADNSRLRSLGWSVSKTLDDALRDLWEERSGGGAKQAESDAAAPSPG